MAQRFRVAAAGVVLTALASSALAMSPATAVDNKLIYVEGVGGGVTVEQILAAGDKPGTGVTWEGIPDGMGAIRNANGTITVFINHEESASDPFVAAIERHYGGFGAIISAVTFNPETNTVISVKDAFKTVQWYDYEAGKFSTEPLPPADAAVVDSYTTPNHTTGLNRFCAATLALPGELLYKETKNVKKYKMVKGKKTAYFKKVVTTYGVNDPIFLTGEEGSDESRAFALNTKLGQLSQVPALGLGAIENVVVAPAKKTKKSTVAFIGEDGDVTDSQLFMYRGTKTAVGTWLNRAGLVNGKRFVASVLNSGTALATDVNVRTAVAKKTLSTGVRQAAPVATTKVKIVGGTLTVTTATAHNLKAGDTVTLSSFGIAGAVNLGVGDSNINGTDVVRTVSGLTFTIGVDADDLAEMAYTDGLVAIPNDFIVITTSAAHGLIEGDRVRVAGNSDLNGVHTISGVPTTTTFTVVAEGAALSTTGGTVAELLDVEFKGIPTNLAGDAQQVLAKLRGTEFSRVEDLFINPANANELFFITTQSDADGVGVAGVKESTRDGGALWKITFANVANPSAGAYLELILDGTEASLTDGIKLNKPDNMTMTNDGAVVLLQEDPGSNDHVARVLALRLSDLKLVTIATVDSAYVTKSNADTYLTNDEETSGIFDATKLYKRTDGASYFMFNAQIHPATKNGGGVSHGTDPLKALEVALARPDLIAQTNYAISNINRASGTATSITITLADVGSLAVNDVMHIFGAATEINGSYAITGVNSDAKTVTVAVVSTLSLNGDANQGNSGLTAGARVVSVDADAALAMKSTVIEAGGLYTLKITSWDTVFDMIG